MTRPARVYLDHNAATPIAPQVAQAVFRAMDLCGNPSSIHTSGRRAREAVEHARRAAATCFGASPAELVFTSGATESNAMLIRGLARAAAVRRRAAGQSPGVVATSAAEHPSVLSAVEGLANEGIATRWLPLDEAGAIRLDRLAEVLSDDCILMTVAAVNHELGSIARLDALVAAAHARAVLVHTDAAQAPGRVPLDLHALGVDAATLSGRKMHAPAGVGLAYIHSGIACMPLFGGGHQEHGLRAGSENVPAIVGMAAACGLVAELLDAQPRIASLRDRLQGSLMALPGARLNGSASTRVAGTLNVAFTGAAGHLVVAALDLEGIEASTGAACSSGTTTPSSVLLALGQKRERAAEAVRFSLGPQTTAQEIDRVAAVMRTIVARISGGSSLPPMTGLRA